MIKRPRTWMIWLLASTGGLFLWLTFAQVRGYGVFYSRPVRQKTTILRSHYHK